MKLPSYSPDVAAQQAEARKIMQSLGYGPGNRLKLKVSTRDFATYRDPAVIFVDQLNKVHFDAELEVIESSIWHNRLMKKDYTVALNTSGVGIDDPDAVLKGAYACNSEANYTQLLHAAGRQAARRSNRSRPTSRSARRSCGRSSACWPRTWPGRSSTTTAPAPAGSRTSRASCMHENSIYNNWRFDNVWLDK